METTETRTLKTIAMMLILLAVSQSIYTALFIGAPEFDRQVLWKLEGIVFVLLAAFSASAAIKDRQLAFGCAAIAFSALLKLLAVGLGLTQFDPFYAAAELNSDLSDIAASILALSFFCYNAGNMFLGLTAMAFGLAEKRNGGWFVGSTTALIGATAFAGNALVMIFGFQGIIPSPIGGALGVLATLLIAVCLLGFGKKD